MATVRKNTLIVDFSVLPMRPEVAKVQKFLCENMKLQLKDVKTIQLQHIRHCVLIEMASANLAKQYQNEHNCQHVIYHEGRGVKIPVYVDDDAITVRILDLSPDIPHTVVKQHMEERYGVVLSIGRERWKNYFPGIPNGVRVLRMHLTKPIPSYIEIEGQLTSISYQNQIKSCRYCQKPADPQQKCSEQLQQKEVEQPPLFNVNDFPSLTGEKPMSATVIKPPSVAIVPTQIASTLEMETVADVTQQQVADVRTTSSDDDETGSSTIETETNKRRLTRRNANEPKKKCIPVGLQHSDGIVRENSDTRVTRSSSKSKLKKQS